VPGQRVVGGQPRGGLQLAPGLRQLALVHQHQRQVDVGVAVVGLCSIASRYSATAISGPCEAGSRRGCSGRWRCRARGRWRAGTRAALAERLLLREHGRQVVVRVALSGSRAMALRNSLTASSSQPRSASSMPRELWVSERPMWSFLSAMSPTRRDSTPPRNVTTGPWGGQGGRPARRRALAGRRRGHGPAARPPLPKRAPAWQPHCPRPFPAEALVMFAAHRRCAGRRKVGGGPRGGARAGPAAPGGRGRRCATSCASRAASRTTRCSSATP
jgi:hypothetical protein